MSSQTPDHWIETRWSLHKNDLEVLQHQLLEKGCLGSYENQDVDATIENQKEQCELLAFFPDQQHTQDLESSLSELQKEGITLNTLTRIPQGNWATEWKKHFKPFFLTPEIVIRPSWEDYTAQGDEIIITLDPGMAFGTGQHDTTRFCAELICEFRKSHPDIQSMLDVGCGSGILSIIAKRIGFETVLGFDIDKDAIDTAHENLERNPEVKNLEFFVSDGSFNDPRIQGADLVVANIIAEALCDLSEELISKVNPGGYLILSGIIPDREEMIQKAFEKLNLIQEKKSHDWHAYLYHKK